MFKRILIAISAVALLASCNGDGNEQTENMPVITLSEGDVKGNTLTFNAKVENAFVAAYLCVAESEATPDATSILSKGRTVKLGEDVVETIYNLQFSTTYNIVLAAMDDDGNIKTANLVMTTGEEPTDVLVAKVDLTHKVFTFKVTPKNSEAVFYKVYSDGETATAEDVIATGVEIDAEKESEIVLDKLEKGSYFVVAAAKNGNTTVLSNKVEFAIVGAEIVPVQVSKVDAKLYNADVLLDIYPNDNSINVIRIDCYFHEGSTSCIGEYSFVDGKENPGEICKCHSYTSHKSNSRNYFTGGTLKIEDVGGGQHKITVKMTRDDEKIYDFTWTGTITWK